MKLSTNFNLRELIRSQTADRLGIDNSPSTEVLINLVYLVQVLEQVRSLCGNRAVSISSGYRSEALNDEIGGAKYSDHLKGCAADFSISGLSNRDVFALITRSHIQYKTLILEFPDSPSGGWVHISIAPLGKNVERVNLIATRKNGATHYEQITHN